MEYGLAVADQMLFILVRLEIAMDQEDAGIHKLLTGKSEYPLGDGGDTSFSFSADCPRFILFS